MRLLNANTLEMEQFVGAVPPYAILSHTWGDQEVTFQEIGMPEREKKKGFAKILGCCRQAQIDLIEWVWIDTCCIDKSSSAELSEAINSMYAFYRNAEICYVFLEDVPGSDPNFPLDQFVAARWFTRGWCLQELIAPCNVEFYAADWTEIGTKLSLCDVIEKTTAIPESVLIGGGLAHCSIAQKMSWASARRTTRIEDEAYCLLGIFGVNMPMLYGEGRRAFYRLQEEIIKQTEDYTFLLWTLMPPGTAPDNENRWPIFAPSAACFHRDGPLDWEGNRLSYQDIELCSPNNLPVPVSGPSLVCHPPQMTSRGLRVSLPSAYEDPRSPRPHLQRILWCACTYRGDYVCMMLQQETIAGPVSGRYLRGLPGDLECGGLNLCLLSPESMARFQPTEIYLSAIQWSTFLDHKLLRPRPPSAGRIEIVATSCSDSSLITLGPCIATSDTELASKTPELYPEDVTNHQTNLGHRITNLTRVWHCRAHLQMHHSAYRLVDVWIHIDSPDCLSADSLHRERIRTQLQLRCQPSVSRLFIDDGTRLLPDDKDSDRARYTLRNGKMVTASVKCLANTKDEGIAVRCILRVCVSQAR